MKKLSIIFSLICMVLAFGACKDDDDVVGIPADFRVGATQMTFLRAASAQPLYVVASSVPQVTSDASWLHVGEVALNGDSEKVYAVVISADEHTGYDSRTATLTVTADGQTAKVAVTQVNAEGIMLGASLPTTYNVAAEGGDIPLTLQATGEYTTEAPSWIAETFLTNNDRALTGYNTSLTVERNRSNRERTGVVTFSLVTDPTKSVSVTIVQAGAATSGATDESAMETARNISIAVNIGNTLEATGGETAWGAARINEDYIRCIKAAGFSAVRLPVAWYGHSDPETLEIDADWIDRVEEVVDLCVANDLYVFMNIHWDGGWMEQDIDSYSDKVDRIQRTLWTQIAERFNYFDKHLVFCGANEAGKNTQASADALKAYMQTFIDVVRASGGNNATRVLVVQAPGTDIGNAVKYCQTLPTDPVADKLMLEIHCYDPSDFTIMSEDNQWSASTPVKYFWGKDFMTGTNRDCNWGDEAHIDGRMELLKSNFTDRNIPVFMGEFGCGRRTSFLANIDEDLHRRSRAYYHKYIVRSAKNCGVIPCYWETPNDLFNRQMGVVTDPDNLNALMEGAAEGRYPF